MRIVRVTPFVVLSLLALYACSSDESPGQGGGGTVPEAGQNEDGGDATDAGGNVDTGANTKDAETKSDAGDAGDGGKEGGKEGGFVTVDCSTHPCQNGATCADTSSGFKCTCAPGYSGVICATHVDDCSPNPCKNGGTCTDGVNAFT
jgi:hypothetical protein